MVVYIGDYMTLEETYTTHKDNILSFLVKKFGLEREDAEDVLHDAYFKAMCQPEPSDGLWEPFLFQCVKTVAMDFVKVEGNRARLFHEKWSKIIKGLNLQAPPEVKITSKRASDELNTDGITTRDVENNGGSRI